MTYIKELAALTAAEMDNIYLRNVPAIILEQYATRLIAAYLAEQEPVVRVVDGGGELHLPKLQWVSANVSLETPIGSDLFLAPPLPAIPDGCVVVGYLDGRIAELEQQNAELVAALELIYSGSTPAKFIARLALAKVKQP